MNGEHDDHQMRAEYGTKPNPDPTTATNAAVDRAMKSERDYVQGQIAILVARLDAMDKAVDLRLQGILDTPHQVDEKVDNLHHLVDEKIEHLSDVRNERFNSIAIQFKERDIRAEREARDNKVAVDAAFAAQKEAAAKQDEANAKAIDKSEKATAETIKTNQELSTSKTDALTKSLDELKLQVSRIESVKVGAVEQRTEGRAQITATGAVVGIVVALLGALALYLGVHSQNTPTVVTPTVTVPAK